MVVRIEGDLASGLSIAKSFDAQAAIEGAAIVVSLSDADRETPDLVRALVHGGARIVEVRSDMPELEDVYLRLIADDRPRPGAPR